MDDHVKINDVSSHTELENARIGYQGAIDLWIYEGEIFWLKFNAFLVANSIVLGSTLLSADNPSIRVLSVGMPIVGIALCSFWYILTERSFDYYKYWIFSAREIEECYLHPVQTVSRGGHFADGDDRVRISIEGKQRLVTMGRLSRLIRAKWVSCAIIWLFILMYAVILMVGLLNR